MLVSVIVPIYKVEPYLRKCVDSILRQTVKDFELILVDDGSPDNCGQICEEYAVTDSRVHVIHQMNGGLSAARNAGIDYVMACTSSEYLTFIDSDDWVEPNYLEELIFGIKLTHGKVSCTDCAYVYESGVRDERFPDRGWQVLSPEDFWLAPESMSSIACAKLFHKSLFCDVRFPVGRIHEDVFTTHRLLFQEEKLAVRGMATYNYRMRSDSIMNKKWTKKRLDAVEALKQQVEYFKMHGFFRAYEFARGRLIAEVARDIIELRPCDTQKAKEYQDFIDAEIKARPLSFWGNRDYYRIVMPSFVFKVRWLVSMLSDAVMHGNKSWLVRQSGTMIRKLQIGIK